MNKTRLLLVEDEQILAKIICESLEKRNFIVYHAPDGEKGWNRYLAEKPDIIVCGHTHILRVMRRQGVFYLNPGAAGFTGFHYVRTVLRFEITNQGITRMDVIELGPNGIPT